MIPDMFLYEMKVWDHIIAAIICILAPALAFTSRKITVEDVKLETADKIRLYHSNALLLIVFALVVTTTWRIPGRPVAALGIDWPLAHPYVTVFVIFIFLFYLSDIFFQYGTKKRRERMFKQKRKSLAFVPVNYKELVHFIWLAVAAGFGEELIFRGYLIPYLISWVGNDISGIITACVGSSLLFAFLHGYQGYYSMAKIFFLAILFSGVFIFSQSLLIVTIVHIVIDTLSGLVSIFLAKEFEEDTE